MPQRQYSFVTSLLYLKVDKPMGANWNIIGDLKISNSESVAKRLVTSLLSEQIGNLESRQILSGAPFVYAISEYPIEDTSPEKQMSVLFTHLLHTQQFATMLWLVKDNSVNFELGFLQYPYSKGPAPAQVTSNSLSASFSDATGNRSEVQFDTAEVKKAIYLYNLLYGKTLEMIGPESRPRHLGPTSRPSRALYFVQAARAAPHLPEKVAYYCTCFESLVSTSPSELAHQVAERVATLIGKDSSDAIEIYHNLKRAYDTRSKLVHGDQLTAGEDRYLVDSRNCDAYLRRLLHILLNDHDLREAIEQQPDKVNEFFLNRLFGGFNTMGVR